MFECDAQRNEPGNQKDGAPFDGAVGIIHCQAAGKHQRQRGCKRSLGNRKNIGGGQCQRKQHNGNRQWRLARLHVRRIVLVQHQHVGVGA